MRAIFQNRAEYRLKLFFFFGKLLSSNSLFITDYGYGRMKNADEKEHTFLLVKKTNKNGRKKVTM